MLDQIANTDEIMSDVMKVAGFVEGAYHSFCQSVSDEGAKTVEGRRLRYVAIDLKCMCVYVLSSSSILSCRLHLTHS